MCPVDCQEQDSLISDSDIEPFEKKQMILHLQTKLTLHTLNIEQDWSESVAADWV